MAEEKAPAPGPSGSAADQNAAPEQPGAAGKNVAPEASGAAEAEYPAPHASGAEPSSAAGPATAGTEPVSEQPTPAREGESPPASGGPTPAPEPADEQAAPASDADPWASYDPVLEAFATELRLGVGTCCGEQWTTAEGRFLGWDNRAGWRCLLRLLRPPQEDVVVLVAEGPPLPGGRPRAMVLGGFPAEFDAQMLHAALQLGYAIGETWGPAEEPAPTPTAGPTEGSADDEPGSV
jgi:hypothetical protein